VPDRKKSPLEKRPAIGPCSVSVNGSSIPDEDAIDADAVFGSGFIRCGGALQTPPRGRWFETSRAHSPAIFCLDREAPASFVLNPSGVRAVSREDADGNSWGRTP
jgi:hypothetical protein